MFFDLHSSLCDGTRKEDADMQEGSSFLLGKCIRMTRVVVGYRSYILTNTTPRINYFVRTNDTPE
jgi:hypothetical protein